MGYVYPTPATTYPYVVIDSVSIAEDVGGISTATVQYLGVLKSTRAAIGDISWLPPAKQRIQPARGSAPNYILVMVDFIYFSHSQSPDLDIINKYGDRTTLPISINGTNLYRSPVAPYRKEGEPPIYDEVAAVGAVNTGVTYADFEEYYGMLCISHFSERAGLFYRITNTYQDSVFGRSGGVFYSTGTTPQR